MDVLMRGNIISLHPRRPELREHASVLIGSNRENNLRTIFQREGVSLRMGTPIAHMIGQSSDASRLISSSKRPPYNVIDCFSDQHHYLIGSQMKRIKYALSFAGRNKHSCRCSKHLLHENVCPLQDL